MTPPAHLLPLALEAMHSADACEVLGDALLECGWWDAKVWLVLYGQWAAVGSIHTESLRHTWITLASDKLPRAIAAVILFGEWSKKRWPLVEANEVRRFDALPAWYTGAPLGRGVLVGIDRAEPSEHESTSIQVIASPHAEGAVYLLNRGALADVWTQELDGAMRRYARDVSYALTARMYAPSTPIQHPDDEEDDDADLG